MWISLFADDVNGLLKEQPIEGQQLVFSPFAVDVPQKISTCDAQGTLRKASGLWLFQKERTGNTMKPLANADA